MRPEDLGTILGVWAHPDDETYCMAGIMARATANGQRVTCVTATKGELGSDQIPPHELAPIRAAELEKALGILGVTDHRWLDYPDGGCAEVDPEDAVGRLVQIIEEVRPDTVLGFGPDGGTWHPDHIATFEWSRAAIAKSSLDPLHLCNTSTPEGLAKILEFVPIDAIMMTDQEPVLYQREDCDFYFDVTGDLLALKTKALEAQPSQTAPFIEMVGLQAYQSSLGEEAYVFAPKT